MSLVKWVFIGVLALPAVEIAAFILMAALIGWLGAATLFVATSMLGLELLRRAGRNDLNRLSAAVSAHGLRGLHLETPGAAAMVGGILLVLPGFITDILGAALLLPAFRRWASAGLARAARRRRAARRGIIDLDPGEWSQIPDDQPRARRPKSRAKRST
jgi:UPF0716 protein FxsA